MKTLSIKQPWAFCIIHRNKNIENRTWNTKFRGRFNVHASKSIDMKAYYRLKDVLDLPPIDHLVKGAIIGTVELVDVVPPEKIDSEFVSGWYHEGSHAHILKDPKPCEPRYIKGQLNYFEVPDEV